MRVPVLTLVLSAPALLAAQSTSQDQESTQLMELRQEIDSIKQGQKRVEKDLLAVLDILSGRKPPLEDVFVGVAGNPSLGQRDAKVTVVEFTDFQCPFCGAYARETLGRLVREYVDTGQVQYIIRNFPLDRSHPLARRAAEAALCAQEQGKFWRLHDLFFSDQKKLTPNDIPEQAAAAGADPVALQGCLDSGKYAPKVASDLAEGQELQVGGTPTFFIGYPDPKDRSRIRAVRSIVGNAPYREFQRAILEALEASHDGTGEQK